MSRTPTPFEPGHASLLSPLAAEEGLVVRLAMKFLDARGAALATVDHGVVRWRVMLGLATEAEPTLEQVGARVFASLVPETAAAEAGAPGCFVAALPVLDATGACIGILAVVDRAARPADIAESPAFLDLVALAGRVLRQRVAAETLNRRRDVLDGLLQQRAALAAAEPRRALALAAAVPILATCAFALVTALVLFTARDDARSVTKALELRERGHAVAAALQRRETARTQVDPTDQRRRSHEELQAALARIVTEGDAAAAAAAAAVRASESRALARELPAGRDATLGPSAGEVEGGSRALLARTEQVLDAGLSRFYGASVVAICIGAIGAILAVALFALFSIRQYRILRSFHRRNIRLVEAQADELESQFATLALQFEDLRSRNADVEADVAQKSRDLVLGEARYQEVCESASDLIQAADASGRITYANAAWLRTLGYAAAEASALVIWDVLHPDSHQAWRALRPSLPHDGSPLRFDLRARDGSVIAVEGHVRLQGDGDGKGATNAIFRNVTERLRVEHAKEEFLALVSHELRTPLAAIRGSLEVVRTLTQTSGIPRVERFVSLAATSSDRMGRLVDDLLDSERLATGHVMFDLQACDVVATVAEGLDSLRALADLKGVVLSQVGPPIALAWTDRDRTTQVLVNLVANAIKFSPDKGQVVVQIATEADAVRVAVVDQGRGIPEDRLVRLFQRYSQADATDALRSGGVGLGLYISRGFVRRLGGDLDVESREGEGCRFWFTLPLPPVGEAPAGQEPKKQED